MKNNSFLLKDILPDFSKELVLLLNHKNESILAKQIDKLEIKSICNCKEDFCSTFFTSDLKDDLKNFAQTVDLSPENGIVNVDVIDNKIVSIEVLYREEIKNKLISVFS